MLTSINRAKKSSPKLQPRLVNILVRPFALKWQINELINENYYTLSKHTVMQIVSN